MGRSFTEDDDALMSELGVEVDTGQPAARTPREERIIAGFEKIQRFAEEHGHPPSHGEDREIFERLYAVRLDRIQDQPNCRELIAPLDETGFLAGAHIVDSSEIDDLDDDAILAELGIEADAPPVSGLRHLRSSAEKKAADEIANREKCEDFESFKPLFEQVQSDLDNGLRETRPFEMKAEIDTGRFFIVGGQKAYVSEKGETTITDQGRTDARLRVIFDNGTESNLLMRSLQRALNKDDVGRRITDATAGSLFSDQTIDGDEASGIIYVLRSKSDHPVVTDNRDLVHTIGVTTLSVEKRIAHCR